MSIQVVDSNGNIYSSFREAARKFRVSRKTIAYRYKHNTPIDIDTRSILSRDHMGKFYRTFEEMCGAWSKKPATVIQRLERGWSLKQALTSPIYAQILRKKSKKHECNTSGN